MPELYPPTGLEEVDALKGLQLVVNTLTDPNAKIEHVRRSVGLLGIRNLLDSQLLVSTTQLFWHGPDTPPDTRIVVTADTFFMGRLAAMTYMQDPSIPIDSLALQFENPELIGVDAREAEAMRLYNMQVPVLFIESCVIID